MSKMSRRIETLASLFLAYIILLCWLKNAGLWQERYIVSFSVCTVCLIMFGICANIGKYPFLIFFDKKAPITLISVFIAWCLISVALTDFSRIGTVVFFALIFPFIGVMAYNCGFENLFSMIIKTSTFMFVIFIIISAIVAPIDGQLQYKSFFLNENSAASYYISVYVLLIAEISTFNSDTPKSKAIFYYILTGISTSLIFYTGSRTGQLAVLVTFLGFVGLKLAKHGLKSFISKVIIPILLCFLILLPSTIYIINAPTDIIGKIRDNDTLSSASFADFVSMNNSRTIARKGEDINSYSSGRIGIWSAYVKELNLFGHTSDYRFEVGLKTKPFFTAHMLVLQYAYNFGVPAGVVFLILNIFFFFMSVRFYFSEREESKNYSMMPFIVTCGFGVISVFESIASPYTYPITLYYYLFQIPLLYKSPGGKI